MCFFSPLLCLVFELGEENLIAKGGWADCATAADGSLHIAYLDNQQVYYRILSPDGKLSEPENYLRVQQINVEG